MRGQYQTSPAITIDVPKSFRIRVAVKPERLGPPYSRPGSILLPSDRLLYQVLADKAAPIIEEKIDKNRSFSNWMDTESRGNMFLPSRTCWGNFQAKLSEYSAVDELRYVMKIDVSNFFGSINLHTLINFLSDAGYPKATSSRLEPLLIAFTGERSSRGILQGLYPSDLLGNFYLDPIDRFLMDAEAPSARFVDDIYIFLKRVDESETLIRNLVPELRRYDLVLNEAKSVIMPKLALNTEEPDLEELFGRAVEEIAAQLEDAELGADYGFQTEWEDGEGDDNDEEDDDDDETDLELAATKHLFNAIGRYPGHEESIERFCLPLFAKDLSDYAVDHVIDSFGLRPSMAQTYASYLARFTDDEDVYQFLVDLLGDATLLDWQKMWVIAALISRKPDADQPVAACLRILRDGDCHDALRAVAAIYVGRDVAPFA
jgi:hypothetical protein